MAWTAKYITGFEMGSVGEFFSVTGSPSVQSTTVRIGTYALQCNTSGATAYVAQKSIAAGGTARTSGLGASCAFWLRIGTLPSANCNIYQGLNSVGTPISYLRLNADGTLTTSSDGSTDLATSSNALSADGQWHLIEFRQGGNAYVDGAIWVNGGNTSGGSGVTEIRLGVLTSCTSNLYFDDVVNYQESGTITIQSTTYKTISLLPTGDPVSLNSWTNGGGGTTSIFEGVNNVPPTGTASATNGIKIKNAASGSNLEYVATMQTYTAAGVPSGSTVLATMGICNDSQEVTTGTKAGDIWIASNPDGRAAAGTDTFDYGNDGAATGTFPTGWTTHFTTPQSSPTVTLSSAPTLSVSKTGSTTRVVDVDYMAINVLYTPPPIGESIVISKQAVTRASWF